MNTKVPIVIKKSNKNKKETEVPDFIFKFLCILYRRNYKSEEEFELFSLTENKYKILEGACFIINTIKKVRFLLIAILVIIGIILRFFGIL